MRMIGAWVFFVGITACGGAQRVPESAPAQLAGRDAAESEATESEATETDEPEPQSVEVPEETVDPLQAFARELQDLAGEGELRALRRVDDELLVELVFGARVYRYRSAKAEVVPAVRTFARVEELRHAGLAFDDGGLVLPDGRRVQCAAEEPAAVDSAPAQDSERSVRCTERREAAEDLPRWEGVPRAWRAPRRRDPAQRRPRRPRDVQVSAEIAALLRAPGLPSVRRVSMGADVLLELRSQAWDPYEIGEVLLCLGGRDERFDCRNIEATTIEAYLSTPSPDWTLLVASQTEYRDQSTVLLSLHRSELGMTQRTFRFGGYSIDGEGCPWGGGYCAYVSRTHFDASVAGPSCVEIRPAGGWTATHDRARGRWLHIRRRSPARCAERWFVGDGDGSECAASQTLPSCEPAAGD